MSISGSTVVFNTANFATVFQQDYLLGGNDTINGNAYDNALKGFRGSDKIDGAGGTDTAYFSGLKSQYQIAKSGNAILVTEPDGTDTLINVERLKLDDVGIAYDVNGDAGEAYRLYQAAFNRAPDRPGLGFQTNALDVGYHVAFLFIQLKQLSIT